MWYKGYNLEQMGCLMKVKHFVQKKVLRFLEWQRSPSALTEVTMNALERFSQFSPNLMEFEQKIPLRGIFVHFNTNRNC